MPRQVDHDARRAEVAAIAARLIAQRGPERVSVRDVAAAAGCSTTIVTHYFASKRDLVSHAYRAAVRATEDRVAALDPASDDLLRDRCEAILPLDDARRETWLTWFAFFGAAVGDPELAAVQRKQVKAYRALLASSIAAEQRAGRIAAGHDAEDEARSLLAFVHGIASYAVFDPDDWPAELQRRMLAGALAELRDTAAVHPDRSRTRRATRDAASTRGS